MEMIKKVIYLFLFFFSNSLFSINYTGLCDTTIVRNVVHSRLLRQVGVLEHPRNSNRGECVDAYNRYAGVPLGSAWCATLQMYSFDSRNDSLLKSVASSGTQNWYRNARARGLLSDKAEVGS
jgi:hypothetical protein